MDQVAKDTKDLVMNLMLNNSVLNPDSEESFGTTDGSTPIENWKEHVT